MLTFITILLTVALVLDCLILGLLVLIQLPKKEAGMGVAFGAGATDALFGAGSGNALTKLTKYTGTAFFVLIFLLSLALMRVRHAPGSEFSREVNKLPAPTVSSGPSTPAAAPAAGTNSNAPSAPADTNMKFDLAPANPAAATNAPAAPGK